MRALSLGLWLVPTAVFAQLGAPYPRATGFQLTWTVGLQSYGPDLTGRLDRTQGGSAYRVDLDSDLGLGRDKASPGLFIDYQGIQHSFQVATGSAEYRGERVLGRDIFVNGTGYSTGSVVRSHVKLSTLDGTWTLKLVSEPEDWLGLDLGAQVWTFHLDTTGTVPPASANARGTSVIPQIGLSGGSRGWNGAVEAKAYARYATYKHARYTLFGADLRVFLVRWFGLRVFHEQAVLSVPAGSVKDDLDARLERRGTGLGAVVRF